MEKFRNCANERIGVYEGTGRTSVEALNNLAKGLRKAEQKQGKNIVVTAVTVTFFDIGDDYSALAYTLSDIW